MKFYLSSYKLGNQTQTLQKMTSGIIGYIPNALDFSKADPAKRALHITADMDSLREIGLMPEMLDLREYFGNSSSLRKKLHELGAVWISGGNVFVLRQAMKLSGFDEILKDLLPTDFVYGGYSAAGCVLSPSLNAYAIVDDATDLPYTEQRDVIWDGLGLIDCAFLPHFDSDHPESAVIAKEVEYCTEHSIPFKTLRDGDVLIID